ncbi:MAG: gamma-glutamyl-gamma-aminobutyrate hydrolase family protein, partial [Bdellovibrionota bacterium]
MLMQKERGFLILDFGSQLTQLIARRYRELGFYSEIHSHAMPLDEIKKMNPYGIVLSGGPNSVYEENSPRRPIRELTEVAPLLGICYGMQLICHDLGGKVEKGVHREYGFNFIDYKVFFGKIPARQKVWMSHGDVVTKLPPQFELLGETENHPAVIRGPRVLGLQ